MAAIDEIQAALGRIGAELTLIQAILPRMAEISFQADLAELKTAAAELLAESEPPLIPAGALTPEQVEKLILIIKAMTS